MKKLLQLLKITCPAPSHNVVPSADPVVARVTGGRLIRQSDLNELNYCRTMGAYYREQMEAIAERTCRVMGVRPGEETLERDWCNEIVFHGQDPLTAINRINSFRSRRAGESEVAK
ncbi:MAG: hypothetical protein ACF788_01215 [Novipirellula sp. JB048]